MLTGYILNCEFLELIKFLTETDLKPLKIIQI